MLSRDQLLSLTQGRDAELFDRSIDLLVSRVRQRLGDDAREPTYIKTVRSEGYVFSLPVQLLGRTNEHRRTSSTLATHAVGASAAGAAGRTVPGPRTVLRPAVLRTLPVHPQHDAAQPRRGCGSERRAAEHLPAEQREAWVPRLERRTYRYLLRPAAAGPGLQTDRARQVTAIIDDSLQHRYPLRARWLACRSGSRWNCACTTAHPDH